MAHNTKETQLMESRLREIAEGSQSIAKRLETLVKTELEVERALRRRDMELDKMREEYSSEIQKLKLEVASMKKDIFALAHGVKVVINRLRTAARTKELDELKDGLKRWQPFEKATRHQAQKIVNGALVK